MIITITGKPCSGKGSVSKFFCEKYNFDYICTGDIFRDAVAKSGHKDVLELQLKSDIKKLDKQVDDQTIEIGKTRLNEDIVFDSRLAWHFIPKSFKVFIDVTWDTGAERLISANRESEKVESLDEAKQLILNRWQEENRRYKELYNVDNLNLDNYDLAISSDDKTPEEIAETIYKNYLEFIKKSKK